MSKKTSHVVRDAIVGVKIGPHSPNGLNRNYLSFVSKVPNLICPLDITFVGPGMIPMHQNIVGPVPWTRLGFLPASMLVQWLVEVE